jgi:ligand-binding SRPBCC domain-containing protein
MSIHEYTTKQFLPIPLEEAWAFFSSPQNLKVITPPELQIRIRPGIKDEPIYDGMLIEYSVKPLLKIPLYWQTKIDFVVPHKLFVDKQLKGPYKSWEHTHFFEQVEGGTFIADLVQYELPLGKFGDLVHRLVVRKKIEHIFAYRKNILTKLFHVVSAV